MTDRTLRDAYRRAAYARFDLPDYMKRLAWKLDERSCRRMIRKARRSAGK